MSIDLRFTKEYNEKQKEALANLLLNPVKTRILLRGGGRSGKTTLWKDYTVKRSLFYPGSKHIVLRKTERDVRNTTWLETYLPTLRYIESRKACKIYKYPAMAEFINGAIIMTGGLASSEVDKVLAIQYGTIHVDEASETVYKSILPLYTRLNDTSKHMKTGVPIIPKIGFTENPPTTIHWTYPVFMQGIDYEDGTPLKNKECYGTILINPIHNKKNLSENYLRDLEALPERSRRRFLLGEFGQLSGLVFDNFDPEKHLIDDDQIEPGKRYDLKKAKLYRSIDFGFVHPFVCLWIALFDDDTVIVYREYYAKGKTVRENSIRINELSDKESYDCTLSDHDSEDRATLLENGIQTEAADKDVDSGLDRLYDLYGVGKIKICRSLKNLIDEHYSYQHDENSKNATRKWNIVKLNDDGIDCLRYFVKKISKPKFNFTVIKAY